MEYILCTHKRFFTLFYVTNIHYFLNIKKWLWKYYFHFYDALFLGFVLFVIICNKTEGKKWGLILGILFCSNLIHINVKVGLWNNITYDRSSDIHGSCSQNFVFYIHCLFSFFYIFWIWIYFQLINFKLCLFRV